MNKKTPVAIFMASCALLTANAMNPNLVKSGQNDMGGLKEWTTDQEIEAESTPDEDAKKNAKKAKKSNICIPIGEGENCW
ncbi:hypothetical protein [Prochlorococcus sp. MIT 1341]|uniref:hypothetical protein n=1 Tax=Prochlorococcus sp. MIT 1341 TaxID=3096221 RepID=UPI002A74B5E5|nr:hypothetical protein [Prochlorococcus sp. MIT 1341]